MGFMERMGMRKRIQKESVPIEPEWVTSSGKINKAPENQPPQQGSTHEADKKKIDTIHQEIYGQFKNLDHGAKSGLDAVLKDKGMN